MTHYTDSKFDIIRNRPAMDLVGIRMGWCEPELAELVAEYDAAIAAEDRAELLRMVNDIIARPDSAFDSRMRPITTT